MTKDSEQAGDSKLCVDSEQAGDRDLTRIFDTIEYPEAFRITYLANAVVFPAYEAIRRDFGVTRPEYVLLACLSHYPELTAQDVARVSRRPRNTISRAVHRMLADGFLVRLPDESDARRALLRITPSGRALHDRIAGYLKKRQDVVLAGLDAKERQLLTRILTKAARYAASLDD